MSKRYQQSALTASQEKFLLARIAEARPAYLRLKRLKEPQSVKAARQRLADFGKRQDERYTELCKQLNSLIKEATEAVIFADSKEAGQAAVDKFIRESAKLARPENDDEED